MIENNITGIVGRKGTGKTHRMARMFGSEERAVLYQPVRRNGEADPYSLTIHGCECEAGVTCKCKNDIQSIVNEIHKEKFRAIYKVPDGDLYVRGQNLVYESILPIVRECYNVGQMTLYIDEAHDILNQQTIDPDLKRVIHLARNNELNIVWIAWSMEVHREIRRATDDFYFYRITETGDLDKIQERCGLRTRERVSELNRLRRENGQIIPGECLFWSASNT